LVSFSKRYRNVSPFVFDITTGLLLEQGQPLYKLEDIWWNDDDNNDRSKNVRKKMFKDSLKRYFRPQFFFSRISYPLAPEYPIGAISNVLRNFADIFPALCLSPVPTTPAISCSPVSTTGDILSPMITSCSGFSFRFHDTGN
jgi:hypothetical protein